MNDVTGQEPTSDLIDFGPPLQAYLAGNQDALDDLPPRELRLALALAPVLGAARGEVMAEVQPADPDSDKRSQRQSRSRDPIAIALGLVPGPEDVLDAARLRSARQRAQLDVKDLARRLSYRGWETTVTEVFRWHQRDTQLAPALLQAVADTLDVPVGSIRAKAAPSRLKLVEGWLDDAQIAAFLADWAAESAVDVLDVHDRARKALVSLNFRNEGVLTRSETLAILQALRRLDPESRAGREKR